MCFNLDELIRQNIREYMATEDEHDFHQRINGVGTPLEQYFNFSGTPLGFPDLKPGEQLVFEHLNDANEVEKVPIPDFESMQQWYNAGRYGLVAVRGWAIVSPETTQE